jgi:hypothetical protein
LIQQSSRGKCDFEWRRICHFNSGYKCNSFDRRLRAFYFSNL